MRKIKVCAGIGDNVWLLQKLINSGEKFDFELPDGNPQRGKQIFDLLPQVANSSKYVKGLSYKTLAAKTEKGKFSDIKTDSFYLSCNGHLEAGKPLTGFLPDLKLSYKLPWDVKPLEIPTGKYIGIYGSAYSMQRAWKEYGAWGVDQWFELIKLIHAKDSSYTFVIIGAEWDNDFAGDLADKLTAAGINFINTVGEPITSFINWVKVFKYAFYFPSGLPILSETVTGSSDCTMFYTSNISKILGNWCDPERKQSGKFKECLFCPPSAIFKWCVDNKKL